jgi:hypothetical protein
MTDLMTFGHGLGLPMALSAFPAPLERDEFGLNRKGIPESALF